MTTDPFDSLRESNIPLAPRPAFAASLRRRLSAALGPTWEVQPMLEVREYTPARLRSLTPYLATHDPAAAIDWYSEVFGAELLGEPIVMDDGRIGHAELRIGDAVMMLAGEFPEEDHRSPLTLGGGSVAILVYVPDSAATYALAVERGATPLRPLGEHYGALGGVLRDPFGHRWFVQTQLEADDIPVEDAPGRRFGDIGYVTFRVPDGERARRFYGALFDWTMDGGHETGSYHIASITPPAGIHGGIDEAEARIFFRVDNLASVVQRVRDLGGEVLSVADHDSGGNAECRDDQGLRFDLFRPRAGY
ncbi:MAG: VOC family protein [Acidimicrobiia bacterium]